MDKFKPTLRVGPDHSRMPAIDKFADVTFRFTPQQVTVGLSMFQIRALDLAARSNGARMYPDSVTLSRHRLSWVRPKVEYFDPAIITDVATGVRAINAPGFDTMYIIEADAPAEIPSTAITAPCPFLPFRRRNIDLDDGVDAVLATIDAAAAPEIKRHQIAMSIVVTCNYNVNMWFDLGFAILGQLDAGDPKRAALTELRNNLVATLHAPASRDEKILELLTAMLCRDARGAAAIIMCHNVVLFMHLCDTVRNFMELIRAAMPAEGMPTSFDYEQMDKVTTPARDAYFVMTVNGERRVLLVSWLGGTVEPVEAHTVMAMMAHELMRAHLGNRITRGKNIMRRKFVPVTRGYLSVLNDDLLGEDAVILRSGQIKSASPSSWRQQQRKKKGRKYR